MKTITDGFGVVRARLTRHGEAWALMSFLAVFLGLPACHLERSTFGVPAYKWHVHAVLRDTAGSTYEVDGDDSIFAEGEVGYFVMDDSTHDTTDHTTPEERMRDVWRRYLRHRLEATHGETFTMRFGTGPWCLASDTVSQTESEADTLSVPETEAPLLACPDPGGATCGNAAGEVPMLEVAPASAAFGHVPVGTVAPETTLTLSNAGAGRLCLDGDFSILTAAGTLPGEFTGTFTDCQPTSMDELMIRRVILSAATRPSCSVRVGFRPRNGGARSASLRVSSNDPASPSDIPLAGNGDAGVLSAPSQACFNVPSEVIGGRTCYRQGFLLVNAGPGAVTITSATVPGADAANWTREYPDISLFPLTLPPGTDQFVRIRACESGIGDSVLTVMSNATTPVIEIPLLRPSSGCTP